MNTCPAVLIELIDELGAENDQLKAQLQQQYHERLVKLVGLLERAQTHVDDVNLQRDIRNAIYQQTTSE